MKIALCCIIKNENLYLKEYVEYYLNLGIDKIFFYDNNDKDGEHPSDVLKDFINKGQVEIVDFRGYRNAQILAYDRCYKKYNQEFDWICFFDIDEFVYLTSHNNLKSYLSDERFKDFEMIHLNWMIFDDNDLIEYDGRPMVERFTRPIPFNTIMSYKFPENDHIKSIIKTGLNFRWLNSWNPHSPVEKHIKCCTNNGTPTEPYSPWNAYNFDLAYLKHFTLKTIKEFIKKRERGFPDMDRKSSDNALTYQRFFKYNKLTEEKEKIWQDYINEQ